MDRSTILLVVRGVVSITCMAIAETMAGLTNPETIPAGLLAVLAMSPAVIAFLGCEQFLPTSCYLKHGIYFLYWGISLLLSGIGYLMAAGSHEGGQEIMLFISIVLSIAGLAGYLPLVAWRLVEGKKSN
jgi:hypothetical protein